MIVSRPEVLEARGLADTKLLLIELNVLRVEVEKLREIQQQALHREEFLSASINQIKESRDQWRGEAETPPRVDNGACARADGPMPEFWSSSLADAGLPQQLRSLAMLAAIRRASSSSERRKKNHKRRNRLGSGGPPI
jgi:hypothetical protein